MQPWGEAPMTDWEPQLVGYLNSLMDEFKMLTFSSDSDIQLLLGPQMVPRPHVRALIRRSTTIDHTKAISLTSWYTVKGYQFLPPPSPLSTHSRPMKPCPGDRPAVRPQKLVVLYKEIFLASFLVLFSESWPFHL